MGEVILAMFMKETRSDFLHNLAHLSNPHITQLKMSSIQHSSPSKSSKLEVEDRNVENIKLLTVLVELPHLKNSHGPRQLV